MRGNFFRFTALFLLALPIAACAQAKYYNQKPLSEGSAKTTAEALADCALKFNKAGLCFTWKWEQKPVNDEAGSFIMKVFRPNAHDGTVVAVDVTPAVVLWMPDMGHGSAPTKITRLDIGTYRVDNVVFIMPGKWQIKFQLKEGTVVKDESIVELEI